MWLARNSVTKHRGLSSSTQGCKAGITISTALAPAPTGPTLSTKAWDHPGAASVLTAVHACCALTSLLAWGKRCVSPVVSLKARCLASSRISPVWASTYLVLACVCGGGGRQAAVRGSRMQARGQGQHGCHMQGCSPWPQGQHGCHMQACGLHKPVACAQAPAPESRLARPPAHLGWLQRAQLHLPGHALGGGHHQGKHLRPRQPGVRTWMREGRLHWIWNVTGYD
jgi:hypothetical protein